jgi:hypothetical protein
MYPLMRSNDLGGITDVGGSGQTHDVNVRPTNPGRAK